MTEYEIADLAVSTQELFIQQWQLAQGMGERAFDVIQQFGNLLFGYLIVAYFIGAKLTKVQLAILNALYLIWHLSLFRNLSIINLNADFLLGEMRKISPELTPTAPSLLAGLSLLSCLILASFYFMWSIRRARK
jgi:hypothetical protein